MLVIHDGKFTIDPQYLGVLVINKIWERDDSKDKALAIAQISWIYYMYHPKSIYRDSLDSQRSISIIMEHFPKQHWDWDPDKDEDHEFAVKWYKTKLGSTPIWDSVRALEQSVYSFNAIIRSADASANEKAKAIEQVADVIQPKLKKLRDQAESDEIIDIKIKKEGHVKFGEKKENVAKGKIMPPGTSWKGAVPKEFDHAANIVDPIPQQE